MADDISGGLGNVSFGACSPVRLHEQVSDLEIEGGYSNLEYLDSKAKEAAVVMISILPMVAVYPFVQKFFVKGMVLGAVKG